MTDSSNLPEKPYPPADDDCCGGGACNPCVWDHYYAERKKWRVAMAELKEKEASQDSQTNLGK